MTFLNFSQLSESIFRPNLLGKYFSKNQANFSSTLPLSFFSSHPFFFSNKIKLFFALCGPAAEVLYPATFLIVQDQSHKTPLASGTSCNDNYLIKLLRKSCIDLFKLKKLSNKLSL
jgi:hypothetical protein